MRFGIVGDPVDHSRSPAIHNAAFASKEIDAVFDFIPTLKNRFSDVERSLRSGELTGVSVTMPHKGNALAAVDVLDSLAARARAVNTIVVSDHLLHGYNTDIDGVRYAIDTLGLPDETPLLLLGYGGAAGAALVSFDPGAPVMISGPSESRALALVRDVGIAARFVEWGEAVEGAIVVNATPLGMHGESLPLAVLQGARGLLDMTYGDAVTPAVATATSLGMACADGLDMLVGQAVAAFELFTGVSAPLDVLEAAARDRSRETR